VPCTTSTEYQKKIWEQPSDSKAAKKKKKRKKFGREGRGGVRCEGFKSVMSTTKGIMGKIGPFQGKEPVKQWGGGETCA